MKFKYPEEGYKNYIRLFPVAVFFFSVPLTAFSAYEYFTTPNSDTFRFGIIVALTVYFAYRAYMQARIWMEF